MSVRSRQPHGYCSPLGKSGIAARGRRLPRVGPILAYLMTVPGEVQVGACNSTLAGRQQLRG